MYFIIGSLYVLTPPPILFLPQLPLLWQQEVCALSKSMVLRGLRFVHLGLIFLNSTYKWNHMVFVFFDLFYSAWLIFIYYFRSTQVVTNGKSSSILWMNYIPFIYIYVGVYIHTHVYINTDNMFFIHSSIHEHLAHFHILPIVNQAAINIRVHISFQVSILVFFR